MAVAVAVVAACVMVLAVAGTFAALNRGDDFDFGNPVGPQRGDSIVLPAEYTQEPSARPPSHSPYTSRVLVGPQ